MLVTCPECGARISEWADPCPHCGLPDAGEDSKEIAEYRVEKWNGKWYPYEEVWCEKCGTVKVAENTVKVRMKLVKDEEKARYEVYFEMPCPKCGRLITHRVSRWAGTATGLLI